MKLWIVIVAGLIAAVALGQIPSDDKAAPTDKSAPLKSVNMVGASAPLAAARPSSGNPPVSQDTRPPPTAQQQATAHKPPPTDWWSLDKRMEGRSLVRGTFNVGTPKNDGITTADVLRWNEEYPAQNQAFQERRRRGEFAVLVLFEQRCDSRRFESVRPKMFARWNALPEAQRQEALTYELAAIERNKGFVDPSTGEVYPGGFRWFCSFVDSTLKKGGYSGYSDLIYPNN
jgi:hypothetical protein